MFMGEYSHTIDTKGRLIVPSKFRESLGDSFVVTKGLDGCLFVYDMTEWKSFEEKLKEQTQELCTNIDNSIGWINVPETKINYPVMYSGDNDFYLHRAVDGSYLRVGSIFLDYRCNSDFTSRINILYGHNMSDGSMFADVMKFIDSSYFDSHNYGWLSTPNAVYKIDFFSVSQPENYDDFYDVNSDINLWLESLRENFFIWRNIGISEEDRFISLSTCTGSEGISRTVLTGRILEV